MSVRSEKRHRKLLKQPDHRGNRSPHNIRLSAGGECRFKVALKRRAGNKIPCERSRLCRGRPVRRMQSRLGLCGSRCCVTGSTVGPVESLSASTELGLQAFKFRRGIC
ncbi:hypothetical protein TNCT_328351 [Trichonephila clavata]|uniref:Uncharacterized protein n=1 Tax=Trichonephila clavata TaxID=2740835 RepID=A0A8X6LJZ8_TRICU|nr:hypothetical protein TNCT_328351 [Trichonephila clavata]